MRPFISSSNRVRQTHRSSSLPIRRTTRGLTVLAILTTLLLFAACEAPFQPADGLFTAWQYGDRVAAGRVATSSAVTQLFATPYLIRAGWLFVHCQGEPTRHRNDGPPTCLWVDNDENQLTMSLGDGRVEAVNRTLETNAASGRFFHAWRTGNVTVAKQYGTSTAINSINKHSYSADAHWRPEACWVENSLTYCPWIDEHLHVIKTRYSGATHKVEAVGYFES